VRGVGDEAPLACERGVEPFEHLVEGVRELAELVVGSLQRHAAREGVA
jgi:hypothetical protein